MKEKKYLLISILISAVIFIFILPIAVNAEDGCCVQDSANGGYVCLTNITSSSDCSYTWTPASCSDTCSSNNGGGGSGSSSTNDFPNPIAFNKVSDLLNSILNNLMGLIAVTAVLFIVIGGVMYVTSGGSETMINRAKKTWTAAVIGLAIALGAPTFLKTIQEILGGKDDGASAEDWVKDGLTLKEVVTRTLDLLLSIFGILAIIALVVGGVMYLTAYGDEKKIDTGKNVVKYAIIGIVVALASLVIVRQISTLLGVS